MARNKKLGGISWNGKTQDVVLEKAVAINKKKNGFLYETFEIIGPSNKNSAPSREKKQDVVLEKAVARHKKKNGVLYETFEKMGPANKDSAP